MTVPRIVACETRKCKHFRGIVGPPDDPLFVCDGFFRGIPEKILNGSDKHAKTERGDGGIVYEKQQRP